MKLAVYYNLYRLYGGVNEQKAEEYKNLLLSKYPESPFAKTILDPNYLQLMDNKVDAAIRFYEGMYEDYLEKKYTDVIAKAQKARDQFSGNPLSSQIAYLGALATGHTSKLPAFEQALSQIISNYPDDRLIVPLAEQHLLYINQNRADLGGRETALIHYDPSAPNFVEEPEPLAATTPATQTPAVTETKEPELVPSAEKSSDALTNEPSLFSAADTAIHFFVVNVADSRANLNSSRFGIGQFNRVNYAGSSIKHRLKNVNRQNQLIFVGEFRGKDAALTYSGRITPLLKDIMKIPADKYSTFIITENNLDKINDTQTLGKYIEFYQKNY